MRDYEGLFLLDPNLAQKDWEGTKREVDNILAHYGEVVTGEKWRESNLAYPVQGFRKGIYYLTYFKAPPEVIDQIKRDCRLTESILRSMIVRIEVFPQKKEEEAELKEEEAKDIVEEVPAEVAFQPEEVTVTETEPTPALPAEPVEAAEPVEVAEPVVMSSDEEKPTEAEELELAPVGQTTEQQEPVSVPPEPSIEPPEPVIEEEAAPISKPVAAPATKEEERREPLEPAAELPTEKAEEELEEEIEIVDAFDLGLEKDIQLDRKLDERENEQTERRD